jgi:long-chain acyl-CoA synthetase
MPAPVSTVCGTIESAARRYADSPALVYEGRTTTYAELLGQVDRAGQQLQASGIGYGDMFAVYAQNRPEILVAYYAAARIGAVMVPINPNMTAAEVKRAVTHCEAKLLYHDDLVAEAATAAMLVEKRRPISSLIAPGCAAGPAPEPRIEQDDDAVVVYTSGSTGAPKAIVLSHRSQTDVLTSLVDMWGITERDVLLVGLPLGYLYGLSTASAAALRMGAKVVLMRRFHPGEALEAFVKERATVFHGVPAMFAMMLDYAEQRGLDIDLSHVRMLICAGAPLPEELKLRFVRRFRKEIRNYYALSECTPVFGVYATDTDPPAGAAGRLAPGACVRIVDAEGHDCPDGTPGELLVKGPALVKRYHKEPGLTAAAFSGGWFKTGDVAWRDAEGFYTITGRLKDIIIRGGANIVPSEVESVLARHEAVQAAAVFGVPDRIFGEVPVAAVVPRAGQSPSAEALISHAEAALADFKVPRTIRLMAELPLGQTGKVDKKALLALWIAGS